MKKIFGLAIMLMMAMAAFAKETPLQVTKTEWGLEISNLDAKGKRICKFADIKTKYCFIIFKNKDDDFNIEKLADEFYYNGIQKYGYVFVLSGNSFKPATHTEFNDEYYDLRSYDNILIVEFLNKIARPELVNKGGILKGSILCYDKESKDTKLAQTLTLRKEEAEYNRLLASMLKTDLYAYNLDKNGDVFIGAYLGESVDNLKIPEKIEGIPVGRIYSMKSSSNVTFKNVTIPKSVKVINKGAFSNCGIQRLTFATGSQINDIGENAFSHNNIQELNLPKQKISIGFDAFSYNKIKKISVYKDWSFFYRAPFGYFNAEECLKQKDNAFILSDDLEEVIFEEGCSIIYPHIFANCKNLKRLSIPSTMKKFGVCAFFNCESLSEIIFAGVPIAEVDKLDDLIKEADAYLKRNGKKFDIAGDIENAFGAAAKIQMELQTNPTSALACFKGCPLPLKTKRILLQMGLPEYAF